MLFGQRTPESLLSRSDSKNPATTCKGITSAGRLCRRGLAASTNSSSQFFGHTQDGVLAVLDAGDAAAFFCWQHKAQAESLVASLESRSNILSLKQKTSIETLVDRLGVLDLGDDQLQNQTATGTRRKSKLPPEWQRIQGPLIVVPEEVLEDAEYSITPATNQKPRSQKPATSRMGRSNVKASWSCCIRADDDDDDDNDDPLPMRRRQVHETRRRPRLPAQPLEIARAHGQQEISQHATPARRKPVTTAHNPQVEQSMRSFDGSGLSHAGDSPVVTPVRPQLQPRHSSNSPPNSQTMTFLSYIPPHLTPAVTSALLTELSRPISEADKEGYIYIFWLTPESDSTKPDDETASSLLDEDEFPPPSPGAGGVRRNSAVRHSQGTDRRTSQALQRYASVRRGPREPRKILLKIGRAGNVHRRLSEWSKQCGQNITLIRYYPHTSPRRSSSSLYPHAGSDRKTVPHVHRVERLIHLELADKRVTDRDECEACGRTHREWFEVEATKRGVQEVDEVIRRWIDWAEKHSGTT